MKVLLDTNVIMDALQERAPFDLEAKEILLRAQGGEFSCCLTANALTDIFYLYTKARGMEQARNAIIFLLSKYTIVSVTHEDCKGAMSLNIEDFEDALVAYCAKTAGADYIVTRDEEFLLGDSPVKTISPKEFLLCIDGTG